MPLTRTVALVTGFLFPYASAALIPDGALQALEAGAKPVINRGVSATAMSEIAQVHTTPNLVASCYRHEPLVSRVN
jgi:hypothetical protein